MGYHLSDRTIDTKKVTSHKREVAALGKTNIFDFVVEAREYLCLLSLYSTKLQVMANQSPLPFGDEDKPEVRDAQHSVLLHR